MKPAGGSPRSVSSSPGRGSDLARRPLHLRLYPDAVLREIAQPIARINRHVSALARDMLDLMRANRGIGLAAPQVGLSVRVIVADIGESPIAVVNPRIVMDGSPDWMTEGCLSLPQVFVGIERPSRVEVRGTGPDGGRLHFSAAGLLARVIQHEVDHLQGILICDYASSQLADPDVSRTANQRY